MLTGAARLARPLVYVPNSHSNTVDVIDPRTYKIVEHFRRRAAAPARRAGLEPEDALRHQRRRQQPDPDQPAHRQAGTADPGRRSLQPLLHPRRALRDRRCRAPRAASTSATRTRLRCTTRSRCPVVGRRPHGLLGGRPLPDRELRVLRPADQGRRAAPSGSSACSRCPTAAAMPQDVKLSPDGSIFYVADMMAQRRLGDRRATASRSIGFIHTGAGAHGLYPSRDAQVPLRLEPRRGSISVISFRDRRWSRTGRSRAAAAPTWAASPPTARCSGSPAATTPWSTRSRRSPAGCSPDPGRDGPAWPLRLAAAGPLLARPHGHPALTREASRDERGPGEGGALPGSETPAAPAARAFSAVRSAGCSTG